MTQTSAQITGKSVAKYFLLPEIMPRIRGLGGTGFGYLAFLIASVYYAVRILPTNHPFLNPGNIGTFGIRQVIAEAANNIVVNRKNLDQIIIFGAILAGLVILALQFVFLIFMLFSGAAIAAESGGDFAGIFNTAQPKDDIAFMLLDYVFGVPDLFGSKVATGTPQHLALQSLLHFYNLALLVVGVLIFLYFVLVVVVETAQTGSPFGERFDSIYAPLRLVFAIGLLVPLNHGLNASQYIVLSTAKLGSGLATNGWIVFTRDLDNPLGVKNASLIAESNAPKMDAFAAFSTVYYACKKAYKDSSYKYDIDAYTIFGDKAVKFSSLNAPTAREKSKGGDIEIVLGQKDDKNTDYPGKVRPYCGKFKIPLSSKNPEVFKQGGDVGNVDGDYAPEGVELIQDAWFKRAQLIFTSDKNLQHLGERMASANVNTGVDMSLRSCIHSGTLGDSNSCKTTYKPPAEFKKKALEEPNTTAKSMVKTLTQKIRVQDNYNISDDIIKRGWGGAGIWYNKIADTNGAIVAAIRDFPKATAYPELLEFTLKEKRKASKTIPICSQFTPSLPKGKIVKYGNGITDLNMVRGMNAAFTYWCEDQSTEEKGLTDNIIWDAMHIVFGTSGLFDLRKNDADKVHPLAALSAVGKNLVESSIKNMMYSIGFAAAGGFAGAIEEYMGRSLQAASEFFSSIALIGLTVGFILFYILPFLPFIYFFFAVASWVKTIFEAMVGAPLWALAHLRIDGNGFPSGAAANGYFLIFEIFLRPILTVIGLIGGMAIFTAMAIIFHELFEFVVYNVTGTDLAGGKNLGGSVGGTVSSANGLEDFQRSIVDEFFFTVVYAVIMYMMAMSSFKMIDMVPSSILRWIGSNAQSFSDQSGDPSEGLINYAAIGGYTVGGKVLNAGQQLGRASGQTLGIAARLAQQRKTPPPGS